MGGVNIKCSTVTSGRDVLRLLSCCSVTVSVQTFAAVHTYIYYILSYVWPTPSGKSAVDCQSQQLLVLFSLLPPTGLSVLSFAYTSSNCNRTNTVCCKVH